MWGIRADMRLYEYEGKLLLRKRGIPTPKGAIAATLDEAKQVADGIGYPVAVKGQILRGGRGKAGAIRFAANPRELMDAADQLLKATYFGESPEKLLIEERLCVDREFYAAITLDPAASLPVLMISAEGGMEIEEIASNSPDAFFKKDLSPLRSVKIHHLLDFVKKTGLNGPPLVQFAASIMRLAELYVEDDAITAEVNPFIWTADGRLLACDAKIEIDDSALFRVKEARAFQRKHEGITSLEAEATSAGLSYVRLGSGNIGLIAGGAGLGMATVDIISLLGGRPANFLDLGGNATVERTRAALSIVLRTPGVEGVLMNLFGGINNCEEMAKGIAKVLDEMKPSKIVVVKMRGHSQEKGWRLLEARKVPLIKFGTTEEAAGLLLQLMQGR
jgi:succinyl-CoA synthetase beta subunit